MTRVRRSFLWPSSLAVVVGALFALGLTRSGWVRMAEQERQALKVGECNTTTQTNKCCRHAPFTSCADELALSCQSPTIQCPVQDFIGTCGVAGCLPPDPFKTQNCTWHVINNVKVNKCTTTTVIYNCAAEPGKDRCEFVEIRRTTVTPAPPTVNNVCACGVGALCTLTRQPQEICN